MFARGVNLKVLKQNMKYASIQILYVWPVAIS